MDYSGPAGFAAPVVLVALAAVLAFGLWSVLDIIEHVTGWLYRRARLHIARRAAAERAALEERRTSSTTPSPYVRVVLARVVNGPVRSGRSGRAGPAPTGADGTAAPCGCTGSLVPEGGHVPVAPTAPPAPATSRPGPPGRAPVDGAFPW